jgi:hypothetical protein
MITKAIVRSINGKGNRCIVRMPLFETAASLSPVEAEALVSITPGFFNNIFVGDVVFVSFEENALEKPIIIGKLYKGTSFENETPGGMGIVEKLIVRKEAETPAETTHFIYPSEIAKEYEHFTTPKKLADYIKWLEDLTKKLAKQLDNNFRCLKNWTQWQLRAENVEVDDGDIDAKDYKDVTAFKYQKEGAECKICNSSTCTKKFSRSYTLIEPNKLYNSLEINEKNNDTE